MNLHPEHLADLRKSGISLEMAERGGAENAGLPSLILKTLLSNQRAFLMNEIMILTGAGIAPCEKIRRHSWSVLPVNHLPGENNVSVSRGMQSKSLFQMG